MVYIYPVQKLFTIQIPVISYIYHCIYLSESFNNYHDESTQLIRIKNDDQRCLIRIILTPVRIRKQDLTKNHRYVDLDPDSLDPYHFVYKICIRYKILWIHITNGVINVSNLAL